MNKRVRKKQLTQKILKAVQSLNAGEAIVVTREYLHQVGDCSIQVLIFPGERYPISLEGYLVKAEKLPHSATKNSDKIL